MSASAKSGLREGRKSPSRLFIRNGTVGFEAFTLSGKAAPTLMVFDSVAANNGTGVAASGPGVTLRLAQSVVTGNASGWSTVGGVVDSYSDNYIDGNNGNTGSLTPIGKQ